MCFTLFQNQMRWSRSREREREETENFKKTIMEISKLEPNRQRKMKEKEKMQRATKNTHKHTKWTHQPKVQTFISIWHETARYQSQINQRWFIFANAFECLNVQMEFFSQISLLFFNTHFLRKANERNRFNFDLTYDFGCHCTRAYNPFLCKSKSIRCDFFCHSLLSFLYCLHVWRKFMPFWRCFCVSVYSFTFHTCTQIW